MALIGSIHEFVRTQLKKERSSWVSSEDIDNALNRASVDLWNEYIGMWKEAGMPVSTRGGSDVNSRITNVILPFSKNATVVLAAGTGTLPADFKEDILVSTLIPVREVRKIDNNRWIARLNRITAAPTTDNPICNLSGSSIVVLPNTITSIVLRYYALPTKCQWAYTTVNDRPVYDDGNSVDFEWGEEVHNEIIERALKYLGVRLEDQIVLQNANQRKTSGL